MGFSISTIEVATGALGISEAPGRSADFEGAIAKIQAWRPNLVLTLTEDFELRECGAQSLSDRLSELGIEWKHAPIVDFQTPDDSFDRDLVIDHLLQRLRNGARVLVHCRGGCGRSGMVILKTMIAAGEAPEEALARLRTVRPCAVETKAQMIWATGCVIAQL